MKIRQKKNHTPMILSDDYLLYLIKKGDRKAFETLFKQYWESMWDIAYKRLQSEALVEKVVLELFEEIWEKREHLQANGPLMAYLNAKLKHQILYYYFKGCSCLQKVSEDLGTVCINS